MSRRSRDILRLDVTRDRNADTTTMTIGFRKPASNDLIIADAKWRLQNLARVGMLDGGELLTVSGPTSVPVAFLLGYEIAQLPYAAAAVYDRDLEEFLVFGSDSTKYKVGNKSANS